MGSRVIPSECSLDSLKRVLKISQKDALKNTLEGIEESLKVGLKLKLNMVVVKSVKMMKS
ncbi:hypothetical protein JP0533_07530 [Helicobacter pylori]